MINIVRDLGRLSSAVTMSSSDSVSSALVGSSRMRIGGVAEDRSGDRDALTLAT